MAEVFYEALPATDGVMMNPVPGAVFQVFEISDTIFSTPLTLRVGAGNPTTQVEASTPQGIVPGTYVTSQNFEHHWKSGDFVWRRNSFDGAKAAVEQAAASASTAALAANDVKELAESGAFDGAAGPQGERGLPGPNAVPTDEAIAAAVGTDGTQSHTALNSAFVGKNELMINPKRYGAKGDGVADDTLAIQSATNSAATLGLEVLFPRGRYRVTSQITLPSGTSWHGVPGAVLDVSGMPDSVAALSAVGSYGTAQALAADLAEGATSMTPTNVTGIVVGDYLKISSSQVFGSTNQPRGEIVRVRSVTNGVVTFEDALLDSYPVASDGTFEKVTFIEDITIEGLNIVGPTAVRDVIGMSFRAVRNLTLRGLSSRNVHNAVIHLVDVVQSSASDCKFLDCKLAGYGYGIAVLYACQDITITNCTGARMRHVVTIGGGTSRRGISRRIAVSNSIASQCDSAGFDCHPAGEYISFIGLHVLGSPQDGITMQGARFTIVGCTVQGASTFGILVQNLTMRGFDGIISGNIINRAGQRGIAVVVDATPAYQVWSGLVIADNHVTDSGMGITCENGSANHVQGLVITGNTVRRCTTSRVVVLRGTLGAVVQGNSLHGPGGGHEVLRLFTALNTLVSGNQIDGAGTAGHGVNIVTSTGCVINGNQIRNGTGTGVLGDAGSTDGVYGDNRNSYTTKEGIAGAGWARANNL